MEQTVIIGTDVAHLVLFHPDDLAHRARPSPGTATTSPIAANPPPTGLLPGGIGSDGEYRMRLTAGERARACMSWAFPLVLRYGRVLIDNTDALRGHRTDGEAGGELRLFRSELIGTPVIFDIL